MKFRTVWRSTGSVVGAAVLDGVDNTLLTGHTSVRALVVGVVFQVAQALRVWDWGWGCYNLSTIMTSSIKPVSIGATIHR